MITSILHVCGARVGVSAGQACPCAEQGGGVSGAGTQPGVVLHCRVRRGVRKAGCAAWHVVARRLDASLQPGALPPPPHRHAQVPELELCLWALSTLLDVPQRWAISQPSKALPPLPTATRRCLNWSCACGPSPRCWTCRSAGPSVNHQKHCPPSPTATRRCLNWSCTCRLSSRCWTCCSAG